MNWHIVDDGAKQTTQTIRHMLDCHGIDYQLTNAPDGGVNVLTLYFGCEVDRHGIATYASDDARFDPRQGNYAPDVIAKYRRVTRTVDNGDSHVTLESTPLADQHAGGWSVYHDMDGPELPHVVGLQNGLDRVFVAFHPDHRARGADVFNLQLQALTPAQVLRLRDDLTSWLAQVDGDRRPPFGRVWIALDRETAEAALISPLKQGKDGQRRGRAEAKIKTAIDHALREG